MHAFLQKPKATQQTTSAKSTIRGRAHLGQRREVSSILHLQRTIGNRAVQHLIEGNKRGVEEDSTTESARFGHDFSRIPVHTTMPITVQPRVTTGMPGSFYEQAGDKGANDTEHTAHCPDSIAHNLGAPRIYERTPKSSPIPTTGGPAPEPSVEEPFSLFPSGFDFSMISIHPSPSLTPRQGGIDDIDLLPQTGGPGPVPADGPRPAADSCDQPRDMQKVTSGPFHGGLTIADYYPDLASRGYPANAGPFDLGNRAGSSVQLIGVIPSPCQPSRFTVAQTYNVSRARFNGVTHALEGQSGDDHARSGRDTSRPPFRQEFLGSGGAPLGYIISFSDPPSIPYSASTTTAEFDANFVSSLVGPAGRRSVGWSVSVRIAGGRVTTNTVT